MKGSINQLIILQVNRKRKRGKDGKDGEDIEMEEGEEKGGKKKERGGKPESEKGEKRKVLYPFPFLPPPPTINLHSDSRSSSSLCSSQGEMGPDIHSLCQTIGTPDQVREDREMMITVVDRERLDYPLSLPSLPLLSFSSPLSLKSVSSVERVAGVPKKWGN